MCLSFVLLLKALISLKQLYTILLLNFTIYLISLYSLALKICYNCVKYYEICINL